MLRDGISSGALDDIFLGGSGSLGGSPGGVGLGGLNGKLMGSGVGTNPLAAIFAASNAGGIPSPAGIQQVCKKFGFIQYRCQILRSFSYCLNFFKIFQVAGLLQSHLAGGSINPSQLQHLMQQHSLMQSHHQVISNPHYGKTRVSSKIDYDL